MTYLGWCHMAFQSSNTDKQTRPILCSACSELLGRTQQYTKLCKCGVTNAITNKHCVECGTLQVEPMWCCTCQSMLPADQFYSRHDKDRTPPDRYRSHCKVCERNRHTTRNKFNDKGTFQAFANGLKADIVESLPTEPLTEAQWLKSCDYFKGCSICGKHDIQVRQYLIPRKDGGRYVGGNMLPMCPTCCDLFRLKSAIDPLHLHAIRENKLDMDMLEKVYIFIKERLYD